MSQTLVWLENKCTSNQNDQGNNRAYVKKEDMLNGYTIFRFNSIKFFHGATKTSQHNFVRDATFAGLIFTIFAASLFGSLLFRVAIVVLLTFTLHTSYNFCQICYYFMSDSIACTGLVRNSSLSKVHYISEFINFSKGILNMINRLLSRMQTKWKQSEG